MTIPDAAVEAGVAEVERITAVPDLEAERIGDETPDGFVVRAVLTAALPHLLTDEMVERAARALHEVSDDVFPFDLPIPGGFVQRRERYLTTARAALEAALGGAA